MKSKYTPSEWEKIVAEYKRTHKAKAITEKYGISKTTLYNWAVKIVYKKRFSSKQNYTNKDIYLLERKLNMLELENNIFKDSGCGTKSSIDEKYDAVNKLKDKYSVHNLCKTLQLSKGTYYNRVLRAPIVKKHDVEDATYSEIIKKYFDLSKKRFGPVKIHSILKKEGYAIGRKRISNLMKEINLVPKLSLSPLPHAHRNFKYRVNRLGHTFNTKSPKKVWVSDITSVFVETIEHKITTIIDLYSRKVIAHNVSIKTPTSLLIKLFDKAFKERGCPENLTFHSDQGCQYTFYIFRRHLKDLKVTQSFSNPGCPTDNAAAEAFFSCMKKEDIAHNIYNSTEELEKIVDDYIDFFNNFRPHRKLKNLTPVAFEQKFIEK